MKLLLKASLISIVLLSNFLYNGVGFAQDIPSSADVNRILKDQPEDQFQTNTPKMTGITKGGLISSAPEGVENIYFQLSSIEILGSTVFSEEEFEHLYQYLYDEHISAKILWDVADQITNKYRGMGYFLSRAFIPAQEIDDGHAQISVIEGYISSVSITDTNFSSYIAQSIIANLKEKKPLKSADLESVLLRLNDIYGVKFDAVLAKADDGVNGSTKLILTPQNEQSRALISANNYGSVFTGPLRLNSAIEHSFLAGHKTTLSGLASLPNGNELWVIGAGHKIQITPSLELDLSLSGTNSVPGESLSQSDIRSKSRNASLGINWTPIRQRDRNLRILASVDALNSNTNSFGTSLTRDKVRAARLSLSYDFRDKFLGLNVASLSLSHGLTFLGASEAGDRNLSRQDAEPDFTKLEASYAYTKYLGPKILFVARLNGQYASKSLYSSEEFGFGGVDMGRAYDFSEITGDHGLAASVELQYTGFDPIHNYKFNPFMFYDIGKVWNDGASSIQSISAASTGFGVRAFHDNGLSVDATFALPLTKPVESPIHGNNNDGIVFRLGLTKSFNITVP